MNGFKQDPIDGVSMVYTFADAKAPGRKHIQYFDNNGSRGIYHDGWYACTFGPLTPWLPGAPGLANWDSSKDVWELYDLANDFSQADDLAAKEPERLAEMKKLFLAGGQGEQGLPDRRRHLAAPPSRRPDQDALHELELRRDARPACRSSRRPGLGRESNTVTIDAEFGEKASGVLYALGGASGGLTLYMDKGQLVYEYNMMIIERYIARIEGQARRPASTGSRWTRSSRSPAPPRGRAHGGRQGGRPARR